MDSFSSGMKDTMSLFMMSSLAANYDAQRENMEENRQLRAANLQRQMREDQRQEFTADMEALKMLSNPANNIPDDVAVSRLNKISTKYGFAQAVTMDDARAFDTELGGFAKRTDLETGAARQAAFQPYAEKIGTNVVYARAYNRHAREIEDYLQGPAALTSMTTVGFTPANAKRFLDNVRPGEALALLKDGDWRKQAILNQANQTVANILNGQDVADGDVSQVLTAAHGAGFKLGVDGAKIIQGTTGEQQYNLAQKDISSLNVTAVSPLSKLWGTLDRDKLAVKMATIKPNDSLATVGLEVTDRIATQLPPEQQKPFHESVAKIEAVYTDASKSFKDFQARYKIAKNSPETTAGDMILLDQQYKIEKQKYQALISPFMAFKSYTDHPTDENFDKVLKASEKLDSTLRLWERDKSALMTVSEQKTKDEILTGKTTRAMKEATNEAGQRFLQMAGEHPDLFDADGTMDVSKAGKLFAPVIQELNKKYTSQYDIPVQLDGVEVVKELASASKRSVPNSDTMMKLTPEQGVHFVQMEMGLEGIQAFRNLYQKPDGTFDRKTLFTQTLRLPFSDGRTSDAIILEMAEGKIRLESGAAVPDNEITRLAKRARPLFTDSDATISAKLTQLESFYSKSLDVVDPRKLLRSRTKDMTPALTSAAKGEEQKRGKTQEKPTDDFGARAEALLKEHPDWSVEQLYEALK